MERKVATLYSIKLIFFDTYKIFCSFREFRKKRWTERSETSYTPKCRQNGKSAQFLHKFWRFLTQSDSFIVHRINKIFAPEYTMILSCLLWESKFTNLIALFFRAFFKKVCNFAFFALRAEILQNVASKGCKQNAGENHRA